MESFLIYTGKSTLLIACFYASYSLMLYKGTFFNLNRIFLITGVIISVLLPFVIFTEIVYIEAPVIDPATLDTTSFIAAEQHTGNKNIDVIRILGSAYAIGTGLFFIRFIIQLLSLRRIIRLGYKHRYNNHTIVETNRVEAPFSFFNYIVINTDITDAELDLVLVHEKAHALQKHSIDMLLMHFLCIFQWFNPIAWLYKKAANENLEFLADRQTLSSCGTKKEYQYLLLEQSAKVNIHQLNIINTFNSSIKKRIVMLNKQKSNRNFLWKYLLVLPLLFLFLYTLNTKTVAQTKLSDNKETSFVVIIDKNTTDRYLDGQVTRIKKNTGTDLVFTNIERNSKNEIVHIGSTFTSKGSSGSYNSGTNEKGIEPFKFFIHNEAGDYVTGYGPANDNSRVFMVGRNTSDEKLDYFTKTFKKTYGGTLNFSNIERNSKGEIIAIASSFIGPDGSKGSTSLSGKLPISHLAFSFSFDKKGKIKEIGYDTKPGISTKANNILQTSPPPLIIIDGIEQRKDFDLNQIDENTIESVTVLKDKNAISQYGKKGKNGVVLITTKKAAAKQVKNNVKNAWNLEYGVMDPPTGKVLGTNNFNPDQRPLFVIDGVIKGNDTKSLEMVSPHDIESIVILKDKKATDAYGEKAKDGVVIITTKAKKE